MTIGVIQVMEAPHYNKRLQKEGTAQFTNDCQTDSVPYKHFIAFKMHLTYLFNYIAFFHKPSDCRRLARRALLYQYCVTHKDTDDTASTQFDLRPYTNEHKKVNSLLIHFHRHRVYVNHVTLFWA